MAYFCKIATLSLNHGPWPGHGWDTESADIVSHLYIVPRLTTRIWNPYIWSTQWIIPSDEKINRSLYRHCLIFISRKALWPPDLPCWSPWLTKHQIPHLLLYYFIFGPTQNVNWKKSNELNIQAKALIIFSPIMFFNFRSKILKMFTYVNLIIGFTLQLVSKYSFGMQDFIVEKMEISWVVL